MTNSKASQRKRKKRRLNYRLICALAIFAAAFFILGIVAGRGLSSKKAAEKYADSYCDYSTYQRLDMLNSTPMPEWIDSQIIPLDGESRNGTLLGGYNDIVIHYVGNPNTTAQQNHDYYCNSDSEVSSHFIVGLDGEIIQCIPLNEMSAASNWRNRDTISIEVCHPDDSGKFNDATYKSLVKLVAWLMNAGGLDTSHIIRHYDITGKECPVYYVQNQDEWLKFKADVAAYGSTEK